MVIFITCLGCTYEVVPHVMWSVIAWKNPTDNPTGDPIMAGLPWCGQKHTTWHVFGSYPHAPYNLLIAMVLLLNIP